MRKCLILTLALGLSSPATMATTWYVEHNPDDPVDQIGAVALKASSGDTILVGPGTYFEHIPLEAKTLTFRSIEGAEATILDGSVEIPGREAGIIYMVGGDLENLVVEGFTFRNGGGSANRNGHTTGGAISWWTRGLGGTLEITFCRFESNTTGEDHNGRGGGIYASRANDVWISSCEFEDNRAYLSGGAIYVFAYEAALVEGCEIALPTQGVAMYGSAIYIAGSEADATIRNSRFVSYDAGDRPTCVERRNFHVHVLGNVFEDHGGYRATHLLFGMGDVIGNPRFTLDFEDNLVWSDVDNQTDDHWVTISYNVCTVRISGNTIVGSDFYSSTPSGDLLVENNVFYETQARLYSNFGGVVACNDAWPDTIEIAPVGDYIIEDNISADPLFYDEGSGDFHIAYQSPCAGENSPEGCGLIGVLDPTCDVNRVEAASWGQVKARFR